MTSQWLQGIKGLLWQIPGAHYAACKRLFTFLNTVAAYSETNKMTAQNLAIVWAPNLIRPQDTNPFATLRDLKYVTATTMWLIEACETVFSEEDAL